MNLPSIARLALLPILFAATAAGAQESAQETAQPKDPLLEQRRSAGR